MTAYLADTPATYDALGLKRCDIKAWEDGIRTDPNANSFEWWYFDARLEDGSALVITFRTKPYMSPQLPLQPMLTINFDRPDGTQVERELHFSPEEFSASTDHCEVRMASNVFAGDLHTYRIHVEDEEITAEVTLRGTVPPWRPETGHIYFSTGETDKGQLFAWLPSVPDGTVEATVTHNGTTETIRGVGYHDHNWGDVPLNQIFHHWWWGRAKIGPYAVISAFLTAEEAYGSATVPLFMIAKDGQVIADDAKFITFSTSDANVDEVTGKPVANQQIYDYDDPAAHFRLTWNRERTIVQRNFIDDLHGKQLEAARAAGFDSSYLRFTGTATLERLEEDEIVEAHTAPAIWELMYLGHASHARIAYSSVGSGNDQEGES